MFNLPIYYTTANSSTYNQAFQLLDSALRIDRHNSMIYDNKHQALVKFGRFEEAKASLQMATENIGNFAAGFMAIAFLDEHLNNSISVKPNYEKATQRYEIRNHYSNEQQGIHNYCEIAFATLCLDKPIESKRSINSLITNYPNNEEVEYYNRLLATFNKADFIKEQFAKR
jgi:tetratricopeptide (TPR) repeat protein